MIINGKKVPCKILSIDLHFEPRKSKAFTLPTFDPSIEISITGNATPITNYIVRRHLLQTLALPAPRG